MTKVITLRKRRNIYTKKDKKVKSVSYDLAIEKNRVMLLLISILSLAVGGLIYRLFPDENISLQIEDTLKIFSSSEWIEIFLVFIQSDLLFLFISFFIGTSYIGAFLTPLPLALKCVFIGYQNGFLYNEYELKGVLFCLVLLIPCYVITTTSLIFASDESYYMSKYLLGTVTNKNTANDISVKLYLIRYLILLAINVVCIAVNSLLMLLLAPKINLL